MARNNNKTLIIILVVLLGFFALLQINNKKKESTLRRDLVDIDTAKVTAVYLYPQADKGKELLFRRTDKGWTISNEGKEAPVEPSTMRRLLGAIKEIRPQQLVAVGKEKWSEYHVDDSLATRVRVMEGKKEKVSLYIGKFTVERPSGNNPYAYGGRNVSGKSYVRAEGDDAVYAVEGFLPMTFNQGFDAWRNSQFVEINRSRINRITFTYPADSGYVLHNDSTGWHWRLENVKPDSVAMNKYLSTISYRRYNRFADDFKPSGEALFTITIEGKDMQPVVLKAYSDERYHLVLHSSQNPETYFADKDSTIFHTFFLPRSHFEAKESS